MHHTIQKDIAFRLVKMADIGYITALYFIAGILLAKLCDIIFDALFGAHDDMMEARKSALQQMLELIGMFWIIGILAYLVRNIVELLPSPFDSIAGLKHLQVSDLRNAPVFMFIFLLFQDHLVNKIRYYYDHLFHTDSKKIEHK